MSSNSPRVSLIIVNYNGLKCLKICLHALKKQSYRDFHVIVVDNGSNDGSQAWIKDHQKDVVLLEMNHNSGFSQANNYGLRYASGEYVALLNNDAIPQRKWLENLVQGLDKAPKRVGSTASKMIYFDHPERIDRAGDGYTYAGAGLLRGRGELSSAYQSNQMVFGACAGAALYRRQLLEEIGGFDETFFLIYEDVDLSFRFQLRGYGCLYVANAVVYHMASFSIGYDSPTSIYYGHHNIERVYLKNMPFKLLLVSLGPHLLYIVLAGFFFTLKGNGGTYWRAKLDVLKQLRSILKKRKEIQRRVTVNVYHLWNLFSSPHYLSRWQHRLKR